MENKEIQQIKMVVMKYSNIFSIIISFIIFLIFFALYFDSNFFLYSINRLAAITGLALISLSLLLSPLSRLFFTYSFLVVLRKPIGLIGFAFIFVHFFISFLFIFGGDIANIFKSPKQLVVSLGFLAFVIFLLMAITSTKKAVELLTYEKWKLLHRFGYIALFLALLHFIFMRTNPITGLQIHFLGYVVIFIALLALLLRIYEQFIKKSK